jgi:hypothetical protein
MFQFDHHSSQPTLRDLIVPGPVERGLYFLEATPDAASRVQDRLVDLLWWDSVAAPGTMPGCLPSTQALRRLNGRETAVRRHRRLSRIGSMFWIDTGHSFNTVSLMSQARWRGMDSGRVARAIHVQHPVGALPYLEALERIPNAALCALGEGEPSSGPTVFSRDAENTDVRPPNSIWWTPLVVISDVMGPLNDPRLPADDRERIAVHIMERLAHLRERAVVLAMVNPHEGDHLMAAEFLRMGTRVRVCGSAAGDPASVIAPRRALASAGLA